MSTVDFYLKQMGIAAPGKTEAQLIAEERKDKFLRATAPKIREAAQKALFEMVEALVEDEVGRKVIKKWLQENKNAKIALEAMTACYIGHASEYDSKIDEVLSEAGVKKSII